MVPRLVCSGNSACFGGVLVGTVKGVPVCL